MMNSEYDPALWQGQMHLRVIKQSQILIFLNFPPLWDSSVVMWVVEN